MSLPHEQDSGPGIVCKHCKQNINYHSKDEPCPARMETMMTSAADLTNERKSTHGDWNQQSIVADNIISSMMDGPNWRTLHPNQRQALAMIATKMSRIVSGNPDEPDHWDDIAGYAYLGKGGHNQQS